MTLAGNTFRQVGKPALLTAGLFIPDRSNFHPLPGKPPAAVGALVTVDESHDGSIRFLVTSGDPRNGAGHILHPGDAVYLDSPAEVNGFRAALELGISAVLVITYY